MNPLLTTCKIDKMEFEIKKPHIQSVPEDFWITGNVLAKRKPMTSATPEKLAKELVSYHKFKEGDTVLEPCAGIGGIVKEILNSCNEIVYVNEVDEKVSSDIKTFWYGRIQDVTHRNFLYFSQAEKFNHIIFNPPFDIAWGFLFHAIQLIDPGGQISCLFPKLLLGRLFTHHEYFVELFNCKELIIKDCNFDCDYGAKTCIIHLTK